MPRLIPFVAIAALLMIGCGAQLNPAKLIVGTWQAEGGLSSPITYRKDGTYELVIREPGSMLVKTTIRGTYRFEGDVLIAEGKTIEVSGATGKMADEMKAIHTAKLLREHRTNITFVNPNEILAEAGGQKVTFKRVGVTP